MTEKRLYIIRVQVLEINEAGSIIHYYQNHDGKIALAHRGDIDYIASLTADFSEELVKDNGEYVARFPHERTQGET